MASVAESECHKDPNFAVICSFLDKYGEILGLPQVSYSELETYLEDTSTAVSKVLVDIHVRLLRRIGRSSVQSDRFEKSIIKFCHHFSEFDAWEVESYGYRHANLKTKLRILKNLLECQFDFNLKFKEKVNESEAESMRFLPIGRDKEGQAYWYFLDRDLNLLVYKEEQDDEDADTWQLVCSDREQLAKLVNSLQLTGNTDFKEEDKTSTESQSSKEGSPARDDDRSLKLVLKYSSIPDGSGVFKQEDTAVKEEHVKNDKDKIKVERSHVDLSEKVLSSSTVGSKQIKIELDPREVENKISHDTAAKEINKSRDESKEKSNSEAVDVPGSHVISSDNAEKCQEKNEAAVSSAGQKMEVESKVEKNKEDKFDHSRDDKEKLEIETLSKAEPKKDEVNILTKVTSDGQKSDDKILSENKEENSKTVGTVLETNASINDSVTVRDKSGDGECVQSDEVKRKEKEVAKDSEATTSSSVDKDLNDKDSTKSGSDTNLSAQVKTVQEGSSEKDASSTDVTSVPQEKRKDDGDGKTEEDCCSKLMNASDASEIIKDPDKSKLVQEKPNISSSDNKDGENIKSLEETDKQETSLSSNLCIADEEEMDDGGDFEDDVDEEPVEVPKTLGSLSEKDDGGCEDDRRKLESSAQILPVSEKCPSGESKVESEKNEEETTSNAITADTKQTSDDSAVDVRVNIEKEEKQVKSESQKNVQPVRNEAVSGEETLVEKPGDVKREGKEVDSAKSVEPPQDVDKDKDEKNEEVVIKKTEQEVLSKTKSEEKENKESEKSNNGDKEIETLETKVGGKGSSLHEDAKTKKITEEGECEKVKATSETSSVGENVIKERDAAECKEKGTTKTDEDTAAGGITNTLSLSERPVDSTGKDDGNSLVKDNSQNAVVKDVDIASTEPKNETENATKESKAILESTEAAAEIPVTKNDAAEKSELDKGGKLEDKKEAVTPEQSKSEEREEEEKSLSQNKPEHSDCSAEKSTPEDGTVECELQKEDAKSDLGKEKSVSKDGEEKSLSKDAGEKSGSKDAEEKSVSKDAEEKSGSKDAEEKSGSKDAEEKSGSKDAEEKSGSKDAEEESVSKDVEEKSGSKDGEEKSVSKDGEEKSVSKEAEEKSVSKKEEKCVSKGEKEKSVSKEEEESVSKEEEESEDKDEVDGGPELKETGKSDVEDKAKKNKTGDSESKDEVEKPEEKDVTNKPEMRDEKEKAEKSGTDVSKEKCKGETICEKGTIEKCEPGKASTKMNAEEKCEIDEKDPLSPKDKTDVSAAAESVANPESKEKRKASELKKTDDCTTETKDGDNKGEENKDKKDGDVQRTEIKEKKEEKKTDVQNTENKDKKEEKKKDFVQSTENKDKKDGDVQSTENKYKKDGDVQSTDNKDKKDGDVQSTDNKDKNDEKKKDVQSTDNKDKKDGDVQSTDNKDKNDEKKKDVQSTENKDKKDEKKKDVQSTENKDKKNEKEKDVQSTENKDKKKAVQSTDNKDKKDDDVQSSENKDKKNEKKKDVQSTENKDKKDEDVQSNQNKDRKSKDLNKKSGADKDKNDEGNKEEESKNDVNDKSVEGKEGLRKLKRGAPEPGSDDLMDSEPNGKRARQIAKVQRTRGGRNAAARGLASRVSRKDSESDDSEPASQPVATRGRGQGRGRRGGRRGRGGVRPGAAAPTTKKTNDQDEGEEEASDQTNAKRAVKKKPDSSSEALSEEEVTPAKKGRSQIQTNGTASTKTPLSNGGRGGRRGGKAGKATSNKKQSTTTPAKEEEQTPTCRRSARVKELRSRRPPTPDTPEEESEATEVDEEDADDDDRFKDNDYLHDSFSPEEESGDEEFLPRGRNFQRQAARTIKEENKEVINDDTPCVKCGKYNHPEMILLCDKCDAGYHTACLRPPLMLIPDGDWFCPPCEHCMLVEKLMNCLQTLDCALKKKNRLVKRQERLAYVGISINNILYKDRPVAVSEKYSQNVESEEVKIDTNGTKEEEEEHSNKSGSSTYESEPEEPQHKFRSERLAMRQAQKRSRQMKHKRKKGRAQNSDNEVFAKRTCRTRGAVSYQFKEFDELINNAIDDDQPVRKEKPPGRSRGKDMSNILGASDEEDEKIRRRDGTEIPPLVVKRKPRRRLTVLESDEEEQSEEESDEFKLSEEEDSDATEVEGSEDDDQEVDEDELGSGSSDSGDWKPKKTWFSKRNVSSRRRKRIVDDDDEDEDYDSDENASKRRSTRNSRRGRIKYDDFESAEETEEETEEEEASFSDFSSEDSQFLRKMKKEKEKRQKKAEASPVKAGKKKKSGVDEEETEGSVSDSSISRKRKMLSEQINKRRKTATDSDEEGGESRGKKKKRAGKIKLKKPKKKKEYSDDDTVTSSDDDASSDETWAPKFRKKRVIRSCDEDEATEEEKPVKEKASKVEKSPEVVKDDLKSSTKDAEKKETKVEDEMKDKEIVADDVETEATVGNKETPPVCVQQVEENVVSTPASKRRGRRAAAGTNQPAGKGKKRWEVTAAESAGQNENDAKDEPVPGKVRRVSGDKEAEDLTETNKSILAARSGRTQGREASGDIFNTPEKKGVIQKQGSAEKVATGAVKKAKIPNFLDVPSGGEESENDSAGSATNMKMEGSDVPPNVPLTSSAPQEPSPMPPNEGSGPPFHGPQNLPQMYGAPYPQHFQRGPHPYPPMYMQGPRPQHRPEMGATQGMPTMGTPSGPVSTQVPPNFIGGPPGSHLPPMTSGSNPAGVENSASLRGPHPYPPGYPGGPPMSQGMPPHPNLEPGQIPPGMSGSRPLNPSQYPMGMHDPRQPPPHQQPWGDMRGQMPSGDPNARFPHYRGPPPLRKTLAQPPGSAGPQHPYYMRPPGGMGQYMPGMRPHPGPPMMNNPLTSLGQMARNLSPSAGMSSPPPKGTGDSSDEGKATGQVTMKSPPRQDSQGSQVKSEFKGEPDEKSSDLGGKDTQSSGPEKPTGKPAKKQKGKGKRDSAGAEAEKDCGRKTSDSQSGQSPLHSSGGGDQSETPQQPQPHYPQHPYAMGPHHAHQYMPPPHYRLPYMGGPMNQGMPHPPGGYPYSHPPPPGGQHHHGPHQPPPPPLAQQELNSQSTSNASTTASQSQSPAVPHPQRGRPPLHQTTSMTTAGMIGHSGVGHPHQPPPSQQQNPPSSSSSSASPSTTTSQFYHMPPTVHPGQHRGPGRPPKYLSKQQPQPQAQAPPPQQPQQPSESGQQHGNQEQQKSSLESKSSSTVKQESTSESIKEEPKVDSSQPTSQADQAAQPQPPSSSSSSFVGSSSTPSQPVPPAPYQQTPTEGGAVPPGMPPNRPHAHGGPPIPSTSYPHPHPSGPPYYSGGQYYGPPPHYGPMPPASHHPLPHPHYQPPRMPPSSHNTWGPHMGPYDPRFRPPLPHHGYPSYPMNSDSTSSNMPPSSVQQQQQPQLNITPPHTGVATTPPHAMQGSHAQSLSTDVKPSTKSDNTDAASSVKIEQQEGSTEKTITEKGEKNSESLPPTSSPTPPPVTAVPSTDTSSTISAAAIKEERRSSATSPPHTSTPSTTTSTTTSTPPPPPPSSSSSSSPAVATSAPSSTPPQPAGQMGGPNTTWSGPNMGPQYHPMSQMGPYNAMPPYGHPPGMMGPHGPYMMGHGDNPAHQGPGGPHMNQGHYFPPPPGQYPVPPHMNRGHPGYNYGPPYMGPGGMEPQGIPPPTSQGFAAEMQGLPPPPQMSKDSIPRSNGTGDSQQQQQQQQHLQQQHQLDSQDGEGSGTSSAPKAKRAKTQKKKDGSGSPTAPRGKGIRGGRGRGGRGGFTIDSLLQSRGGADGSKDEGGEPEEGQADMKDIVSYVTTDEYFKQQTSS